MRKIASFLSENKIMTRSNKPFCISTIRGILINHKYAGISVRQKYDFGEIFNKNTYPKIRNEDEWIINKSDKIPPIINIELFYLCQRLLKNRAFQYKKIKTETE